MTCNFHTSLRIDNVRVITSNASQAKAKNPQIQIMVHWITIKKANDWSILNVFYTFNLFPQISCACRVSIALFAFSLFVNFA